MVSRLALAFALALPISVSTAAQTNGQNAPPELSQKGSQAATRLNMLLKTTGWAQGHDRGGVLAHGTLARVDDKGSEFDLTGITLEMRADHRIRMELDSGGVSTVSDAVGSSRTSPSGRIRPMLAHVALSIGAPYFPFLTDLAAYDDPAVQIVNTATATIGNEDAVGVSIHRSFPSTSLFQAARENSSDLTLWTASKTGLPLKIDFQRLATDNANLSIQYSLRYGDWQLIDGVLVPMQIDEDIGSRTFLRYRFRSVEFSNIPDSHFVNASDGGRN